MDITVCVGLPRIVEYRGEPVATGIYKQPVGGRIAVNEYNLAGDAQADLSVHGGYSKAVYVGQVRTSVEKLLFFDTFSPNGDVWLLCN